jgi:hypothetical protein
MKKIIQLFSSVKIAVVCLLLLFVLTFWGTVAQVQQGLYVAQERFFHSSPVEITAMVGFAVTLTIALPTEANTPICTAKSSVELFKSN